MKFFFIILFIFSFSCSTASRHQKSIWPQSSGIPNDAPSLKEVKNQTILTQGKDGFYYLVGDLKEAELGSPFYVRFSGKNWPIEDLKRPPVAMGYVAKKYDSRVALVSIDYQFPEVKLEGLSISWESYPLIEHVGKGIAPIIIPDPAKESTTLKIALGKQWGVQAGDIYLIAAHVDHPQKPSDLQLAKRAKAICHITKVSDEDSECRLWEGSNLVNIDTFKLVENDTAIFLEHTFALKAAETNIELLTFTNDPKGDARKKVQELIDEVLSSVPIKRTTLTLSDIQGDAQSVSFHQMSKNFKSLGEPKLVVGGSLVDVDGITHLFVNYTNASAARGPGMNAAPPERGIDLGPLDKLKDQEIHNFAQILWSAVLVQRGRTSEALMHLRYLLSNPNFQGSMRWHARDQFAMRWAALERKRDALWLVRQDEKEAGENKIAELNALGTRVRLLKMLNLKEQAIAAAKHYVEERENEKGNILYHSAFAMYGEMLFYGGKIEEGKAVVQDLKEKVCKECEELPGFLSMIYWSVPKDQNAFSNQLLKDIAQIINRSDANALASLRIAQGLNEFTKEKYDDALIALLEAEELYIAEKNGMGISRTNYFMFLVEVAREEPQKAFERSIRAIRTSHELDDFKTTTSLYQQLTTLYLQARPSFPPGPYLGAGRDVLAAHVQTELANGNFVKASRALLAEGTFLMKISEIEHSQAAFRRGATYAIQATQFDIASLCHIRLAMIARGQRDRQTFEDEMKRATLMGKLSGDNKVLEIIEKITNPPKLPKAPTQLL